MDSKSKNNKKILKWNYPFITSLPQHANLFSIILANKKSFLWIYNHYIQLRVNKDANAVVNLDFCTGDNWEMIKKCPFIKLYSVSKKYIEVEYKSIGEYVKKCIDLGYYIILPINVFYISSYEQHGKYNINHDMLVIGYDDENKVFHIADFLKNSKYDRGICSYQEFENAYYGFDKDSYSIIHDIYAIELLEQYEYTFDIDFFLDLLNDFQYNKNSNKRFRPISMQDFLNDEYFSYGLEVYDVLINYLHECNINENEVHIRSFHLLYDHKVLITKLLNFLVTEGWLSYKKDLLNISKQLLTYALELRNLLIKFNLIKNKQILEKSIIILKAIKDLEKKLIIYIFSNLDKEPQIRYASNETICPDSPLLKYTINNGILIKSKEKNSSSCNLIFEGTSLKIFFNKDIKFRDGQIIIDNKQMCNFSSEDIGNNGEYVIYENNNLEIGYHTLSLVYYENKCEDYETINTDLIKLECYENKDKMKESTTCARFLGIDDKTKGSWYEYYGKVEYDICGIPNELSSNLKIIYYGFLKKIWTLNSDNILALRYPNRKENRIAGCIYFKKNAYLDILVTGNEILKISFYILDWYSLKRHFTIKLINMDTGRIIDSQVIKCDACGIYYSYQIRGHIRFEFVNSSNIIATISGIFFDK